MNVANYSVFKLLFMLRLFLLPILSLSCAFCFAQSEIAKYDRFNFNSRPHHYAAQEYFIEFPPSWTLDTTGLLGTQFIVTSPKENDKDRFRENVSLMIHDSKNLHDFVEASETRIQTNGMLLESRRRINFDRQEYHVTLYTVKEQPDLVFEQYYFFKYWFIYELTYVSERKTFFENRAQGERVLNSFSFNYYWTY